MQLLCARDGSTPRHESRMRTHAGRSPLPSRLSGFRGRPRRRGRAGWCGRRRADGDDLDAHPALRSDPAASPSATTTCSARSARIRTMRTRSWTCRSRRSCGWRGTRRWWRSARRGSTTSTTTARRRRRREGFRNHIAAARATQLPLVIHARDADEDTAAILEEETAKGAFPAVLHCYTGGAELARRGLALGLYVSFSGILTFKKSDALRAIAADVPLDRLLVETDAPYLAPGKFRGKRNEPAYVAITAAELAKVKGVSHGGAGARHDREFLPPLQQDAARRRWPHEHALHDLGLRLLRRRAARRQRVGRVRSDQPEEPAAALRAAGRAVRQGRTHDGAGRYAARHPRAAAGCARRDAGRGAVHARPRRPHARHRRSARHRSS